MLKLDKKIYKIVTITMMIIMMISAVLPVFADVKPPNQVPSQDVNSFDGILGTILGAVQAVGSAAAVIVLVIVGIRYMTGSVEEKAEYKKTMIPYVVGAVLVFAASNVAMIIYNLRNQIGG